MEDDDRFLRKAAESMLKNGFQVVTARPDHVDVATTREAPEEVLRAQPADTRPKCPRGRPPVL